MKYEVPLYLGTACVTEKPSYDYPIGEKQGFLFYLKAKKDSEYDEIEAKSIIEDVGLSSIQFSEVGKVSQEKIASRDNK